MRKVGNIGHCGLDPWGVGKSEGVDGGASVFVV
jgi:hypothetical protein